MAQLTLPSLARLASPSLVVERIGGGMVCDMDSAADTYPASMIKLPIAYATAEALASGAIDDAPVVIDDRYLTNNDAPSSFVPGYTAGLWELVHAMIAFSDNVATNALIDRVGRVSATKICERAGLQHTVIRRFLSGSLPRIADPDAIGENVHAPVDAALLLKRIALGEVPFAKRLLAALDAQHWNSKLSAGLMPDDRFAHKTGDTSDVSHDGGIVTTAAGNRYVVVLYTRSPSNDETDAAFAALMRELRRKL